jgi:hypothetical protein
LRNTVWVSTLSLRIPANKRLLNTRPKRHDRVLTTFRCHEYESGIIIYVLLISLGEKGHHVSQVLGLIIVSEDAILFLGTLGCHQRIVIFVEPPTLP